MYTKMENNMSGKEQEKKLIEEHRRKTILEAAERLFLTKGYDSTTMQDVAEEAGYSKGTLYNSFETNELKDALYLAIATKAYELFLNILKKRLEKLEPGIQQIKEVGFSYYDFIRKYPAYANIFHDVAQKVPDLDSKNKEDLNVIETAYLQKSEEFGEYFVMVLGKAIQSKQIRSDKPPLLIGFMLSNLTNGMMKELMQHKNDLERYGIDPDELVEFTFDIIAEGLKPKEKFKVEEVEK
jgi:AcrR family transcriptional regulator